MNDIVTNLLWLAGRSLGADLLGRLDARRPFRDHLPPAMLEHAIRRGDQNDIVGLHQAHGHTAAHIEVLLRLLERDDPQVNAVLFRRSRWPALRQAVMSQQRFSPDPDPETADTPVPLDPGLRESLLAHGAPNDLQAALSATDPELVFWALVSGVPGGAHGGRLARARACRTLASAKRWAQLRQVFRVAAVDLPDGSPPQLREELHGARAYDLLDKLLDEEYGADTLCARLRAARRTAHARSVVRGVLEPPWDELTARHAAEPLPWGAAVALLEHPRCPAALRADLLTTHPRAVQSVAEPGPEVLAVCEATGEDQLTKKVLLLGIEKGTIGPEQLVAEVRPARIALTALVHGGLGAVATQARAAGMVRALLHARLAAEPHTWRALHSRLNEFPGTVVELITGTGAPTPSSCHAQPNPQGAPNAIRATAVEPAPETGTTAAGAPTPRDAARTSHGAPATLSRNPGVEPQAQPGIPAPRDPAPAPAPTKLGRQAAWAYAALIDLAGPEHAADALDFLDDTQLAPLAGSRELPQAVADHVLAHGGPTSRRVLAGNPSIRADLLEQLILSGDQAIASAAYRNPHCTLPWRQLILSLDGIDRELRAELLAERRAEALWPLLSSPDLDLLRHVAFAATGEFGYTSRLRAADRITELHGIHALDGLPDDPDIAAAREQQSVRPLRDAVRRCDERWREVLAETRYIPYPRDARGVHGALTDPGLNWGDVMDAAQHGELADTVHLALAERPDYPLALARTRYLSADDGRIQGHGPVTARHRSLAVDLLARSPVCWLDARAALHSGALTVAEFVATGEAGTVLEAAGGLVAVARAVARELYDGLGDTVDAWVVFTRLAQQRPPATLAEVVATARAAT